MHAHYMYSALRGTYKRRPSVVRAKYVRHTHVMLAQYANQYFSDS